MVILRRADHLHFIDNAEEQHERLRSMPPAGEEWDWIPGEMRPFADLCSEQSAHTFVRALALCHFDSALKRSPEARAFLDGDMEAQLALQGIAATVHRT